MSSLWWLEPGWSDARCACGARIAPEGDPDWGACFNCFSAQIRTRHPEPTGNLPCDICKAPDSCAASNGYNVCSQPCDDAAQNKPMKPLEERPPI